MRTGEDAALPPIFATVGKSRENTVNKAVPYTRAGADYYPMSAIFACAEVGVRWLIRRATKV